MWQGKVTILANKEVAPGYFRMVLEAPKLAGQARAGQFIHFRVSDRYVPLLRRPLSLYRIDKKRYNLEILYGVAGKGTKILAEKQAGEKLDILGPLGQGFKLPGSLEAAILIAGGIGVAPLVALAEEIVESGKLKVENIHVFIGARTKELVLCKDDFQNLGAEVEVATDDGSQGYQGLVTDLLKKLLPTADCRLPTVVYACGPQEMLREIAVFAVSREIPCQISMESQMGCGVGVCRGCVVRVKRVPEHQLPGTSNNMKVESYQRVCKEGPVFEAGEIIWE